MFFVRLVVGSNRNGWFWCITKYLNDIALAVIDGWHQVFVMSPKERAERKFNANIYFINRKCTNSTVPYVSVAVPTTFFLLIFYFVVEVNDTRTKIHNFNEQKIEWQTNSCGRRWIFSLFFNQQMICLLLMYKLSSRNDVITMVYDFEMSHVWDVFLTTE